MANTDSLVGREFSIVSLSFMCCGELRSIATQMRSWGGCLFIISGAGVSCVLQMPCRNCWMVACGETRCMTCFRVIVRAGNAGHRSLANFSAILAVSIAHVVNECLLMDMPPGRPSARHMTVFGMAYVGTLGRAGIAQGWQRSLHGLTQDRGSDVVGICLLISQLWPFAHICSFTWARITCLLRLAGGIIVGQDVRGYVNAVICKVLMMSGIWYLSAQRLSISGRQEGTCFLMVRVWT